MKLNFKIGNIASLFSVLIGTHLYLSYLFLKGYLNSFGLEILPIITMEDLLFPMGFITKDILIFILSGYILSLILEPLLIERLSSNEKILKLNQKFIKLFSKRINNNIEIGILKITLVGYLSFVLFLIVHFIYGHINSKTELTMVIAIFLIPTLLIIFPKYKLQLTAVQFIFIGLWIHLFVYDVIAKTKQKDSSSYSEEYNFEYLGKFYRTNKENSVIFYGYKNLVFHLQRENEFLIIPTDQIQNLRYSLKK